MREESMEGMIFVEYAAGFGKAEELVPVNAIDMELIGVCLERMDV